MRHASLPSRIVELGPGNGSKLALLLGDADTAHHVRRIDLVDVSAAALAEAARRLRDNRTATITTHEARYEQGLSAITKSVSGDERTLVLFLGSNIGNFDPQGAATFLREIRGALGKRDAFLIGADLVKPERELLLAYDDPLGVTAAFNKNLLLHLNSALGAAFDVDAFEHRAVWNAAASRVEMHLVSRHDQSVAIPLASLALRLAKGESIWTESSYKYTSGGFEDLLASTGFAVRTSWIDSEGQFLLVLCCPV